MPTMISHSDDFDSLARQSVFLGLVRLQQLRIKYPDADDLSLVRAAVAGAADGAGADIATAMHIIDRLDLHGLVEDAASMRRFLRVLLEKEEPPWILAGLKGRQALRNAMPSSVGQCFSFGNLFDAIPAKEVVTWWDEVVARQRLANGLVLNDRGREGERLTIAYESERLSGLGINLCPKWVALDDETLGYDVLSFNLTSNSEVTTRLIEVKACTTLPLRIFLTRNEWERATQAPDTFAVHVWHLPTQTLREITPSQISEHIPADAGRGRWDSVQIILSPS